MTTALNPRTEMRPLSDLRPHPGNPRRGNVEEIARSLSINGQYQPIVALPDGTVLAGSHRLAAARSLGWDEMLVTTVDADEDTARRIVLADNRTSDLATYDDQALADLLASLPSIEGTGFGADDVTALLDSIASPNGVYAPFGTAPDGSPLPLLPPGIEEPRPTIADRFLIPPFSVLDARGGPWLTRKRQWLGLGIRSEEGRGAATGGSPEPLARARAGMSSPMGRESSLAASRGDALTLGSLSGRIPDYYWQKQKIEETLGREISNEDFEAEHLVIPEGAGLTAVGTSVFDPVLCELTYRWYSPPGGRVLDPFAGGSVRGVVASVLGRSYTGIDLRAEQIAANNDQARTLCPTDPPRWIAGDSRDVLSGDHPDDPGDGYDLLFSCPPYADLEVYSDDPADISTMPYDEFIEAYRQIITDSVDRLANDRFACFVVGEVRDKKGAYRNFIGDTVAAFVDAGCSFYNESILVTPAASLAVRITKQFTSGRKIGKCHQNVLVFVKGDGKKATEACGEIIIEDIEAFQ